MRATHIHFSTPRFHPTSHLSRRHLSSSIALPTRTKFRHIPEGKGDTLLLHGTAADDPPTGTNKQSAVRHVGTTGLATCVGVYFSIDTHRCFLAHINAYILRREWRQGEVGDRYLQNATEHSFFQAAVHSKLADHAKRHDWCPEQYHPEILRSLMLTCPKPFLYSELVLRESTTLSNTLVGYEHTGAAILQGFKDFLGVPDDTPSHRSEVFVVEHPASVLAMLTAGPDHSGSSEPEHQGSFRPRGFEQVEEEGLEDWTIELDCRSP